MRACALKDGKERKRKSLHTLTTPACVHNHTHVARIKVLVNLRINITKREALAVSCTMDCRGSTRK